MVVPYNSSVQFLQKADRSWRLKTTADNSLVPLTAAAVPNVVIPLQLIPKASGT